MTTMKTDTTSLTARREELAGRLAEHRTQLDDLAGQARATEQDRLGALEHGQDTAPFAEQLRNLETQLGDKERDVAHFERLIVDIDAELARVAPHEKQDTNVAEYATAVEGFMADIADINDTPGACVEAIHAAVSDYYDRVSATKQRYDDLIARRDHLRQRSTELDRTDQIPSPPDWLRTADEAFRGGELIHVWRAPLDPKLHDYEAAAAATNVVIDRMREPARRAADAQRQLRASQIRPMSH